MSCPHFGGGDPQEACFLSHRRKPDTDPDSQSRVALLQLASSSMALLVHVTGLTTLPNNLDAFLRRAPPAQRLFLSSLEWQDNA